jgi:hypothetical protein
MAPKSKGVLKVLGNNYKIMINSRGVHGSVRFGFYQKK